MWDNTHLLMAIESLNKFHPLKIPDTNLLSNQIFQMLRKPLRN